MKLAILQFNPRLGAVDHNMKHADDILNTLPNSQIDLLVLPEMAFSGYNFPGLQAVKPYLEPTAAGPSTQWAIRTATSRQCTVIVGYPEIATIPQTDGAGANATTTTTTTTTTTSITQNYNSTVIVSPNGTILANYRKSFLYYTDETWAEEGFRSTPDNRLFFTGYLAPLGTVGHGICMDINPYKFNAPWTDYEFAREMLAHKVKLVVLSMAWLTRLVPEEVLVNPDRPDMETVAYWLERFWPFVETQPQEPITVVFANRCGTEGTPRGSMQIENGETVETGDRVCYAGSSCVMRFQNGSVKLWEHHVGPNKGSVGLMGKGEEGLLIVETSNSAGFLLQQKAV